MMSNIITLSFIDELMRPRITSICSLFVARDRLRRIHRLRQYGAKHPTGAQPVQYGFLAGEDLPRRGTPRRCGPRLPDGILQCVESSAICQSRDIFGYGHFWSDHPDLRSAPADSIRPKVPLLSSRRVGQVGNLRRIGNPPMPPFDPS